MGLVGSRHVRKLAAYVGQPKFLEGWDMRIPLVAAFASVALASAALGAFAGEGGGEGGGMELECQIETEQDRKKRWRREDFGVAWWKELAGTKAGKDVRTVERQKVGKKKMTRKC